MPDSIAFSNYIVAVFFVVLISSCVLNLLRQHYIYQLTGIAFFFIYFSVRLLLAYRKSEIEQGHIITASLTALAGISACLTGMVLGFWIFPSIRKLFKG